MGTPTFVYGIDPGLKGGVTRIEVATGLVRCWATPIIKGKAAKKGPRGGKIPAIKDEYDPIMMADLIEDQLEDKPVSFWIEKVGAMPGQGVTSMFRFGFGAGLWHGICGARGISPNLIAPGPWKASFGLNDDKNAARDKASEIAPDLSVCWPLIKHDGIAESFLIGHYGMLQLGLTDVVYKHMDPHHDA